MVMERFLAHRIAEIASDDRGGAAELALNAVNALRKWLGAQKNVSSHAVLEAVAAIQQAHPEMAPLGRIAVQIASTSRASNPAATHLTASARIKSRRHTFARSGSTPRPPRKCSRRNQREICSPPAAKAPSRRHLLLQFHCSLGIDTRAPQY